MESGKSKPLRLLKTAPEDASPGAGVVYGVLHGQREAASLRLIRRNGKPITMPYGLLPIVWGDWLPTAVLIEYAGFFTVRVNGDELDPLELLISERKVTWIRAGTTAGAGSLAVTSIDLIRRFPSRDVAGGVAFRDDAEA